MNKSWACSSVAERFVLLLTVTPVIFYESSGNTTFSILGLALVLLIILLTKNLTQFTMDARILKLIDSFEKKGWRQLGSANIKRDWWFDDIVILSSIWKPVGKQIYLTLLTDPMEEKRKIIWAVAISVVMPMDKSFNRIKQVSLNELGKISHKEFVADVNDKVLNEN